MGIVSLVLGWIPLFGWIICIVAMYCGLKVWRKNKKEGTNAGGRQAAAGFILGLLSLIFGMMVFAYVSSPSYGNEVKINSLTKASAMPTETLGMYINIPDALAGGDVSARFSDGDGYKIDVPLFYYNQEAAAVSVPVYFSEAGGISSGRVNLTVIVSSNGIEYSSNSMELEIEDLPKVKEKPGTITVEYLARAIEASDAALDKLALISVEGVSKSELQQALTKQRDDLVSLKNHSESSMSNPANPFVIGEINGQRLSLDEETLELSDRMIAAFLMQYQQANSGSAPITGNLILSDSLSFSDYDITLDSLKASFDTLFRDIGNGLRNNKETMVNVGEVMIGVGGAVTLAPVPGAQVVGPLVVAAGASLWFAALHINTACIMAADLSIDSASDRSFASVKAEAFQYMKALVPRGLAYLGVEKGMVTGYVAESFLTVKSAGSLINEFNEQVDKAYVRETYLLMTGKLGDVSGRITSQPPGIDCPGRCTKRFPKGTVVTLSAISNFDSGFDGWNGACSGTGSCEITMDRDTEVAGTFSKREVVRRSSGGSSGSGHCSHSSPKNACGHCSSHADCGGGNCYASSVSKPPFC